MDLEKTELSFKLPINYLKHWDLLDKNYWVKQAEVSNR